MRSADCTRYYIPAVAGVLLLSCALLDPGDGDWEHLGLNGLTVTALADTDWGLFAGTRGSGVFRYHEATAEWEPVGLDEAAIAALLPLSGPTPKLLAGVVPIGSQTTASAVFATEDAGATWIGSDGGLASENDDRFWAYSLAQDPLAPNRLYMGESYSILGSDDGGRTWRFLYGSASAWGAGIHAIVASPTNSGEVWAGGQSALGVGPVFHSVDAGENWSVEFPGGHSDMSVNAIVIDPANADRLWAGLSGGGRAVLQTNDGGVNWHTSFSEPGVHVFGLAFDGDSDRLYAVGQEYVESTEGVPLPPKLRFLRLDNPAGNWNTIRAPDVRGGVSVIVDRRGNLVVGIRGHGVLRYKPD